jgi:hypothetical protein
MLTILIVYGLGHSYYWPWKAPYFNMLDLLINFFLIQVVSVAASVQENEASSMFLETYVFFAVGVMYAVLASHFLFCAYKLMQSSRSPQKEPSKCLDPTVGLYTESMRNCTNQDLMQSWLETCHTCLEFTKREGLELMDSMNIYDKQNIMKAMSVWYAQCPGEFPANAMFPRIIGIQHTSWRTIQKSRESRGVTTDAKGSQELRAVGSGGSVRRLSETMREVISGSSTKGSTPEEKAEQEVKKREQRQSKLISEVKEELEAARMEPLSGSKLALYVQPTGVVPEGEEYEVEVAV